MQEGRRKPWSTQPASWRKSIQKENLTSVKEGEKVVLKRKMMGNLVEVHAGVVVEWGTSNRRLDLHSLQLRQVLFLASL